MEFDLLRVIEEIPLLPLTVVSVTHGYKPIVVSEVLNEVCMERYVGDDDVVDLCSGINEVNVLHGSCTEELSR